MRFLNRITAGTLLAGSAIVAAGAGCSTGGYQRDDYYDAYAYDDGGHYYDDGPVYYSGHSGYYYAGDRYPHHGGHYHGGHGGDGHYHGHREHRDYQRQVRVPRDAERVAGGEQGLAYTAPQSGRVYVRDEKTGKVIYRGRVDAGDEVKVAADAKGRRVSVDGRTARGDLSAKPRDRDVFFQPDRGTASRSQQARSERAAQQAAARVEARETRAAKAEARTEARAAARSESRGGSANKGSGEKSD